MSYTILDNREENRFELHTEGYMAIAEYILAPGKIIFTHTEVPIELEGKGVGSALAKYALDQVAQADLKIVPMCPFIKAYIERHKEYQPLLYP